MLVCSKEKKIIVTEGRGYFGHKLRNELKKMGAVVELFVIFVLEQNNSDGKTSKNGRNRQKLRRTHKM